MTEGNFELAESFGIDNGELDGLTPQECFCLGCELYNVLFTAQQHERQLQFTVRIVNKERIERMLKSRGRTCSWQYPHDDVSEGWVFLTVLTQNIDTSQPP